MFAQCKWIRQPRSEKLLEIFFEDRSKFDKQNPISGDLCNRSTKNDKRHVRISPNPDPKVNDGDIQRRLDNPRGGPPSSHQSPSYDDFDLL